MSKRRGKLRSIHAHIEPMKDSTGKQGYSVRVRNDFDGDEKEPMAPTPDGEKTTFAPSRKHAIGHLVKHASAAMAMHEGRDAGEPDGDEPAVPANHPLKKLRRSY